MAAINIPLHKGAIGIPTELLNSIIVDVFNVQDDRKVEYIILALMKRGIAPLDAHGQPYAISPGKGTRFFSEMENDTALVSSCKDLVDGIEQGIRAFMGLESTGWTVPNMPMARA